MPTYDYVCRACDHAFEYFQSMKDSPLTKCPACKKAKLERLIGTGAAVLFKGSGFFQTDYRSEAYKKAHATEHGAGGDAAATKTSPANTAPNSPKPNGPAPTADTQNATASGAASAPNAPPASATAASDSRRRASSSSSSQDSGGVSKDSASQLSTPPRSRKSRR